MEFVCGFLFVAGMLVLLVLDIMGDLKQRRPYPPSRPDFWREHEGPDPSNPNSWADERQAKRDKFKAAAKECDRKIRLDEDRLASEREATLRSRCSRCDEMDND